MKRANNVTRIGGFVAARTRMPWICTLLLACLLVPSGLVGQTEADRESVNRVVERLLADAGQLGDEIPHSPGAWSLVIARFAEGDSREVRIPARAGEEYLVSGYAESHRADVDICVYDPAGDPVDCDTLMDRYPVAAFTAKTEGAYRAVMTAASVEGGGTSFAGMIVVKVVPDRGADPFGESNDGRTPLHSALRYQAEPAVVSRMLDAGADEHLTPLQLAALRGDAMAVNRPLADGADPRAENEDGNRSVDLAWEIRGSPAWRHLVMPAGALAPGRTFNGSLTSSDAVWDDGSHYDVWTVTAATVGQRVVIDMESDDVDAYLRVLRKDGTPVAADDDGGSGSNARVEFRAVYAGEYLVVALSFGEEETGGIGWGWG